MKIKDFAEGKQLTKQAIYKALNRAGYSAKTLTDRSGNLTKKGINVLNRLFPSAGDQVNQDQPEPADQDESIVDDLRNQVKELKERCEQWETRYFEYVNQAKQENEQLRILLQREQELRYYAENKGFFKRLFAGKKVEKE